MLLMPSPSAPPATVPATVWAAESRISLPPSLPSNGRAVHYNGSSLLQWKSVRLDVTLSPGECGGGFFTLSTSGGPEFGSKWVKVKYIWKLEMGGLS